MQKVQLGVQLAKSWKAELQNLEYLNSQMEHQTSDIEEGAGLLNGKAPLNRCQSRRED
jgi:hypothetical protein